MSIPKHLYPSASLSTYYTLTAFTIIVLPVCFLWGFVLLDRNICCVSVCLGRDAGRGDPGDATGLHLTVSRSEQK